MKNLPKKSKTVNFNKICGAEVLLLKHTNVPTPGYQEVRIQVESIGINNVDVVYRKGSDNESQIYPPKLRYDAAGIVEAIGPYVTNVGVGDIVNCIPIFDLDEYSANGEYIIMPAYAVHIYPTNLSYYEAASLWTSYLTMYNIIVNISSLNRGDFVLINADSSNTGFAAIQMTNYVGGVTIALTTSLNKKEVLLKNGASHVIVTSEEDIVTEILRITNKIGVHLILDPVVDKKFSELLRVVVKNGKVFINDETLNKKINNFTAFEVLLKKVNIERFYDLNNLSNKNILSKAIPFIDKGINDGKLKPIVDKIFDLNEIVQAHKHLEYNQPFGKIVLKI